MLSAAVVIGTLSVKSKDTSAHVYKINEINACS